MTFRKILCPTDFSTGSQQAVRGAVRMARDTDAELVLVHAWSFAGYPREEPFPPQLVEGIIGSARRALDGVVSDAAVAGAKHVTGKLLAGAPWLQIVEELEKEDYDLCVIGTHGRTGLARVLLGSVAEKIVRHAPCPVLVVRSDAEVKTFHHALVPTDFSESAAHALDLAAAVVDPRGTVTLQHVIEEPYAYSPELEFEDYARARDTSADDALNEELERFRGISKIPIRGGSRIGHPGAQILASLDDDASIDVVVMGSHGWTGITRALMGSVAEKVVRHARCPVLVCRQRATLG